MPFGLTRFATLASFVALAGCPSSAAPQTGTTGGTGGNGGSSQGGVVVPTTNACTGDATLCIAGSMVTKAFSGPYLFGRVFLYDVFPSGTAQAVGATADNDGGNEVASDGTFAFSSLTTGNHYYLRALA